MKLKKKSLREQYKGLSFAEASEKINKKYQNKDTDMIEKKSFELEMQELILMQNKARTLDKMESAIKADKNGGTLPKYGKGTLFPDATLDGQPQYANNLLGQISYPNTYADPNNNTPDKLPLPAFKNPFAPTGPPKPFSGQVDTLSPGITNNAVNDRQAPDTSNTSNLGNAYTPALIGQGISTLVNSGILAGGYDKVAPVDNPNEAQVANLMANRSIDTTQQTNSILSAYNAARANLSNARSANVRNALDANLTNNTQDALAKSNLNQQQANNQYTADLATTLNNLGQQKAQAQTLSNDLTARNKGQFESNLSAFGASVADNSKFFTTSKLNEINNKLMGDILSQKYANIGLNRDVVQRLSEGKTTPDDLLVLKNAYGEDQANIIIKKFGEK